MAAAKTKKRSIIIGNKEYTMPHQRCIHIFHPSDGHICAIWKCATALWTQKRNGRCTQDSSSWI